LAVSCIGGASAYADTLTNGPTIQLGQYSIPGNAPENQNGGDLLPLYNGIFDGGESLQFFAPDLQSNGVGSALKNSVIENVASLVADGWNTAQAPVLAADYNNLPGINSGLQLDYPLKDTGSGGGATSANATWNIAPALVQQSVPSNVSSTCSGMDVTGAVWKRLQLVPGLGQLPLKLL
jgi:hypothetical protein